MATGFFNFVAIPVAIKISEYIRSGLYALLKSLKKDSTKSLTAFLAIIKIMLYQTGKFECYPRKK